MASQLGICNRALIILGAETINSLSENTKNAKLCNEIFDDVRDELLDEHSWNFSIKRAYFTLLASTPDLEWESEFQLPTDCLMVLKVGTTKYGEEFAIEEGKLRTNGETAAVKYRSKVTDVSKFSKSFTKALAYAIARELSYSIVQSSTRTAQISAQAEEAISLAKVRDAQEGTPEQFFRDTWQESREVGPDIEDGIYGA